MMLNDIVILFKNYLVNSGFYLFFIKCFVGWSFKEPIQCWFRGRHQLVKPAWSGGWLQLLVTTVCVSIITNTRIFKSTSVVTHLIPQGSLCLKKVGLLFCCMCVGAHSFRPIFPSILYPFQLRRADCCHCAGFSFSLSCVVVKEWWFGVQLSLGPTKILSAVGGTSTKFWRV